MSTPADPEFRNADRLRYAEPVTIRLYGIKEITLPTYLLWYLATLLLCAVLIGGANEILTPQTDLGLRARRVLATEPWVLDIVAWVPFCLILGLVFELFEGAFVLFAFRRRFRQLREEYDGPVAAND